MLEVYAALIEELKPGEQLLWNGYCRSRLGQQSKSGGPTVTALVGAIVGIFIGIAITGASGIGVPLPLLVTVPLGALAGFYVPPTAAYRKKRTVYAITNRRVLVVRDLPRERQVRSLPLQFISDIKQTNRHTGCGSIVFSVRRLSTVSRGVSYLQFVMISRAPEVAALAAKARDEALSAT